MGFPSCAFSSSTIKISSPTRTSLWFDCKLLKIKTMVLSFKTMLPLTILCLSRMVCLCQPRHRCVTQLLSQMGTIRARFRAMTVTRYYRSLREVAGQSLATNILAIPNKQMIYLKFTKVSVTCNAEYHPCLFNSRQIDPILVTSTWLLKIKIWSWTIRA